MSAVYHPMSISPVLALAVHIFFKLRHSKVINFHTEMDLWEVFKCKSWFILREIILYLKIYSGNTELVGTIKEH